MSQEANLWSPMKERRERAMTWAKIYCVTTKISIISQSSTRSTLTLGKRWKMLIFIWRKYKYQPGMGFILNREEKKKNAPSTSCLSYLLKLLFQIRKDVTVSHKFKVGKINPLVSLHLEEDCRFQTTYFKQQQNRSSDSTWPFARMISELLLVSSWSLSTATRMCLVNITTADG